MGIQELQGQKTAASMIETNPEHKMRMQVLLKGIQLQGELELLNIDAGYL